MEIPHVMRGISQKRRLCVVEQKHRVVSLWRSLCCSFCKYWLNWPTEGNSTEGNSTEGNSGVAEGKVRVRGC